ncbi:MAG: GldG family protein, partial [Clostridia bacterium]|nr:GldG family protein [Clostridia bacterium]
MEKDKRDMLTEQEESGQPAVDTTAEKTEEPAAEAKEKQPKLHNKRRTRIRAMSILITAAVAAVVVVLNVVVGLLEDRYPITIDLTKDDTYSLSQNSIDLIREIKKPVDITFFMNDEMLKNPSTGDEFADTVLRQMNTFAQEYRSRSGGQVNIHFVDLTESPALAKQYDVEVGLYDTLFQCGDKTRLFSIDKMYKVEQVPNYTTYQYDSSYYSLVEQTFATGILSVVADTGLSVTFLTGNGEQEDIIADMGSVYEDNGYAVQKLDFTTAADIDENCKVLLIIGPTIDFTDAQIERLTQWVNNGGMLGHHLYVTCNYLAKDMHNLYEFLETYYGVAVSDDVIYETDRGNLPITSSGYNPFLPYVKVSENELMPDATGQKMLMGYSLALDTKLAHDPDNLLIFNTDILTFNTDSTKLQRIVYGEDGQATLEEVEDVTYPIVAAALACEWNIVNNENVSTYVFVCGSYVFAMADTYGSSDNQALVLDPINTMCGNEISVSVQSQQMNTEALNFTVKTANILGLGVLTIGLP